MKQKNRHILSKLQEQEEREESARENYKDLRQEVDIKTKKLKKLFNKLQSTKGTIRLWNKKKTFFRKFLNVLNFLKNNIKKHKIFFKTLILIYLSAITFENVSYLGEIEDINEEHRNRMRDLELTLDTLMRENKFFQMITDNFVPSEETRKLENR